MGPPCLCSVPGAGRFCQVQGLKKLSSREAFPSARPNSLPAVHISFSLPWKWEPAGHRFLEITSSATPGRVSPNKGVKSPTVFPLLSCSNLPRGSRFPGRFTHVSALPGPSPEPPASAPPPALCLSVRPVTTRSLVLGVHRS